MAAGNERKRRATDGWLGDLGWKRRADPGARTLYSRGCGHRFMVARGLAVVKDDVVWCASRCSCKSPAVLPLAAAATQGKGEVVK
jgi:hypothetical protein